MGKALVSGKKGVPLPTLTNPALAADIRREKQAISQGGTMVVGTAEILQHHTMNFTTPATEGTYKLTGLPAHVRNAVMTTAASGSVGNNKAGICVYIQGAGVFASDYRQSNDWMRVMREKLPIAEIINGTLTYVVGSFALSINETYTLVTW